MPYFIYRISPQKQLALVRSFAKYQEARQLARSLRASQAPEDRDTIKIIFAKDAEEAERLLLTPRERKPSEDD
ncbi:MAG: hypothetical protein D6819_08890 [Gammaproteobacteria bacterium]|nr:MAG: hypothetical protein D6819_08890 [Gammaproteobacteria bacterium]